MRSRDSLQIASVEGATGYEPGVCNIGPEEIAARRRWGHAGTAATGILFGVLVAAHAPRLTRLLVALPAAGAAAGYLQAQQRFCAAYGSRGVYNFGPIGSTEAIADDEARAKDRRQSLRIGAGSAAIGVVAGVVAALLPV